MPSTRHKSADDCLLTTDYCREAARGCEAVKLCSTASHLAANKLRAAD